MKCNLAYFACNCTWIEIRPKWAQKSGSVFLHFRYAKLIHKIGFSKLVLNFLYKTVKMRVKFICCKHVSFTLFMKFPYR